MKKKVIVFVLICVTGMLSIADENIATLEKKLSSASTKEKIPIHLQLAKGYNNVSPEKQIAHARQALELLRINADRKQEADARFWEACGHLDLNETAEALAGFAQSEKLHAEIGDFKRQFDCIKNRGWVYENMGNYEQALALYRQGYQLALTHGLDKSAAVALSYIGIICIQKDQYNEALEYMQRALRIMEPIGDKIHIANIENYIGTLYCEMGKYEKGLAPYQRSLAIYRELGSLENTAIALNNLGTVFEHMKKSEEALKTYREALGISKKVSDKMNIGRTLDNMAGVYVDLKQLDLALDHYEQALRIWREIGNQDFIGSTLGNIGELYIQKKDWKKAKEYVLQSLRMAEENKNIDSLRVNYTNLSEIYESQGDFRRSLDAFKKSAESRDRLIDTETSKKMAEMEVKYEAEKKQRRIDLLQKNNDIQKLMLSRARFRTFAFVFGFALLLTLLLLLFRQYLHLLAFWKKKNYISHYKLDRLLGSGGMGMVWQATDVMGAGKTVALKVIREELAGEPSQRKRFLNESYLVDQIDHPNIVKVFERGEHEQNLYIAMEFLHGQSLGEIIRSGEKLPVEVTLDIVHQIADALSQLHRQGILHRDIKPENVMRIKGEGGVHVKLLDFGLAQAPSLTRLTETGEILGTVTYLSPELITERKTSPASDIYALGVVFYELLTLEKPFFGDNPGQIIRSILDTEALEPIRFRSDLPVKINALVMRMIDKDPEKRPSGEELLESLNAKGFSAAANQWNLN